jgi:hypothetical protein
MQIWMRHGAVVVADIDGDEKPDVAAVSKDADIVVWYKNNHPGLGKAYN